MKVSTVALGSWLTYGGSVADGVTSDCVRAAIEHGVNFIDLADVYAQGEAERVVGQAIKDYKRSNLVISSKLFWPMSENVNDRGLSRKHIMESVEGSLKRLSTDYLDIYFCHRFDPETPLEETVRAMDDLVHQGKILYWGTSVWEANQIEDAVEIARRFNAYPPQVEQPRYNMLDRHIEPEIMPTCARHGIGLTVWSPLAQGLLTGKYNDGAPAGSRGAISNWLDDELNEENLDKVRQLTAIAEGLGITTAQLALAWILRRPEISCVITGATRPEHVESNVKAVEIKLDADVLERIETIL
jgi:voltage-dependent potassium channel beta subunit